MGGQARDREHRRTDAIRRDDDGRERAVDRAHPRFARGQVSARGVQLAQRPLSSESADMQDHVQCRTGTCARDQLQTDTPCAGRDLQARHAHGLARGRFRDIGVGLDGVGARVVVARTQAVEQDQRQQRHGRDSRRLPDTPIAGEQDRRDPAQRPHGPNDGADRGSTAGRTRKRSGCRRSAARRRSRPSVRPPASRTRVRSRSPRSARR